MKAASAEVLEEIKMSTGNYRIGLSKVLFKAGILGSLEEPRDAEIEKLLQLSEEHQGHAGAEEIADCSAEEPEGLSVAEDLEVGPALEQHPSTAAGS